MASLRTMFLAVYASNGLTRFFFLPICYILLCSPFLALIGHYLGFTKTISNYLPEDFTWFDLLPQITLSAVFLLLPTRLLSGSGTASTSKDGGKRGVQSLPYWIPGAQNLLSLVFGGEQWLRNVSKSSINSIIAYSIMGVRHNIVVNDTLMEDSALNQIIQKHSSLQEPRGTKWATLRNAFRAPDEAKPQLLENDQEIKEMISTQVLDSSAVQSLTKASLAALSESLPDFITFNSSIVDQMQWERVADVELTQGTSEAECNLFALLNEFCCNAVLPPILGAQFTESYQLLATDLATFNQSYWALALGLPRWSPMPGLPGAALAQKRLLRSFTKFLEELTNPAKRRVPDDDESVSGGEETDADIVTPIMKMNELFTKNNLPMSARAAVVLQLVHSILSEVVPLVFWTLLNVCAESAANDNLLQKIKEQTKSWAQAIQPPSIHPSFPAPPEIKFSSSAEIIGMDRLALPHACINEVRRLYTISATTYLIKNPITIQEASIRPNEHDTIELEVGSYIDVGLSRTLINSSPSVFPDPATFNPFRFQAKPAGVSVVSPLDTTEPYITPIVVSIVVGILQLWEISPAPKKTFMEHMQEARQEAKIGAAALTGDQRAARSSEAAKKEENVQKAAKWTLPRAVDGAFVKVPKGDVRVRIRRRENLPERRVVARQ